MSSGQSPCTPAKLAYFSWLFPHLDPDMVKDVVEKLRDPDDIEKKLDELSIDSDPAMSVGQQTATPPDDDDLFFVSMFPNLDPGMVKDVVEKLKISNEILDALYELSNVSEPAMTVEQQTDRPPELDFYCTMFSDLHEDVVKGILEKFAGGSPLVIEQELKKASRITDDEGLRKCAKEIADNQEMPLLYMEPVPGDGDCGFHAVAKAFSILSGKTITGSKLKADIIAMMTGPERELVIEELRMGQDCSEIQDDEEMIQFYIQKLRRREIYCGNIEFRLMIILLRVRIQIWVPFATYKRNLGDKSARWMPVYQVSEGLDYVSLRKNSFGQGNETLHLLYRGNIHFDCLVDARKHPSA